ncbi:thioredoxin domain-containing protein [Paenibacillus xerothermodurans]|uniref:Thioredoxin domain-containing protein n=1 Tax=Paenibacillus xerothermodurans TaxID=1977292 RepID=A0A2W1NM34_PAEXE|nr:thioredoxin domain-containing protein [Paenibacillus xerothermodurans]PZE20013.1 hypothetical protein CBW46_015125 [Paenibacillus xerothermodurans]
MTIRRPTYWLVTGAVLLCLAFWAGREWLHADIIAANAPADGPNEITGDSGDAIRKLKAIMDADDQTFIYFYETDCELCEKLEPMIYATAEQSEVQLYRFNLTKYEDAMQLKNHKGMPLVDFYKDLPAVGYYNKGWLIAWAEGEQSQQTYHDFYEHFRFGDDDQEHQHDHEHEHEHEHDHGEHN